MNIFICKYFRLPPTSSPIPEVFPAIKNYNSHEALCKRAHGKGEGKLRLEERDKKVKILGFMFVFFVSWKVIERCFECIITR